MLTADELLRTLWRRKVTFLLAFTAVMAAVAAATFLQPKTYASTAYILVGSNRTAASDYEATQTNQVVLKTYAELLQTRNVATEVARSLPFAASVDAVERAVSVAPIAQSQLVQITATAGDPTRAQILANTYAEVFVSRAASVSAGTGGSTTATLADRAAVDPRPVSPRPKVYLAIGVVLAGLLASAVALLRDRSDQRIQIEADANELFGIPILARLPEQPGSALRALTGFGETPVQMRETFDLLLTNIVFARLGATQRETIAVVSSGESEGKTTCCIGLARAAASHELDVLLVDGDLRRGHLSELLELHEEAEENAGFAELLTAGRRSWRGDAVGVRLDERVMAIPAGDPVAQPTALLSASIPGFVAWAAAQHPVVIIDTPPVSVGADASLVAAATAEVLLVVNVRVASRASVLRTIDQLRRVKANVIGVVLNRTDSELGPRRYYGDRVSERSSSAVDVGTQVAAP